MSSPNTRGGGGFIPNPCPSTLGYTNPRAQRVAALAPVMPETDEPISSMPNAFMRHRPRRGLSVERMQQIISPNERSITDFVDVPISPEEIRQQPKKTRPYYEHLDHIHTHYEEVDGLLSGELPAIIVESFFFPPDARSYTSLSDAVSERHGKWNIRGLRRTPSTMEDGEEPHERTPLVVGERERQRERIVKLAININTVVNLLLVAAKVVAVWYSDSISLTASLIDSALDLLSTFIIVGTTWAIGVPTDNHMYPAGKRRFEPLGVLVFSVVMICSFVQIFIESLQRVYRGMHGRMDPVDLNAIGIGTMVATIAIKAVLWVWCSQIPSSAVQALAQDAENDVWLNVISLLFPYIGQKLGSPLFDPIGGLCLSSYIIVEWIKTLLQNFANLSGRAASADQYTRVLYMVSRFNPVREISAIECYHIGDDLVVEVDVILPNTSLHFAHDIGETIQCMLENLDGVLRAYVHTDYSSSNPFVKLMSPLTCRSQHTARQRGPNPVPLPPVEPEPQQMSGSATPKASDTFLDMSRGRERTRT